MRIAFLTVSLLLASCIPSAQVPPSSPRAEVKPNTKAPAVRMPGITTAASMKGKIRFQNWQLDTSGSPKLLADVVDETGKAKAKDFVVIQYDSKGRKIKEGVIHFPQLTPGERGEAWLFLESDDVADIWILPRNK